MNSDRHLHRLGTCRLLFLAFTLVFSTLGGVGATLGPALAQGGTATIEIANYACPEELDAYNATPDELAAECFLADMFPPVTFTLEHPDGTLTEVDTVDGYATFEDVALSGDAPVTLSEVLPPELGQPVVACTVTNQADGAVIVDVTLVPVVNGNAIQFAPEAGGTLSCNWFNVFGADSAPSDPAPAADDSSTPDSGLASVTVVVHGCPVGTDPASTAADFLAACTGDPVALLSAADFEDYYEANTTDGLAGGNAVTFVGVPATELTLSHLRPSSVTTLAVYCADASAADDPAAWEQASVFSGVSVDREIAEGESITCHLFSEGGDVDGDASGNMVEVRTWTCVAGTDPGQDEWSYYFDQCETVDTETTFTLTGSAGAQPAEASGDWSTWTGVSSGAFTIEGTNPAGSGTSVVVCGTYEGSSLAIEWPVVTNGQMDAGFEGEAAQIMTCDWFNLPA